MTKSTRNQYTITKYFSMYISSNTLDIKIRFQLQLQLTNLFNFIKYDHRTKIKVRSNVTKHPL